MKVRTPGLVAGTAALIAACPATATLTGIVVETEPHDPGLVTCRVYAEFSEPDDLLVAVCGTADAPLQISVTGGTFNQSVFGGDLAPSEDLVALFPSLALDTFVTIGLDMNDGTDATLLTPGWPGFGAGSLDTTNGGWLVTPNSPQGLPDETGRVLLGQFVTAVGAGVDGRFLIQFVTDGVHRQAAVGFCHSNQEGPCFAGDLDGDNLVTIEDFLVLLGFWGPCADCPADIDNDGLVGITDFLALLGNWTVFVDVPTGAEVDADLNGDGVVNIADLLILLSCQGPAQGDCNAADIDGDGTIGVNDLLLLIANWG